MSGEWTDDTSMALCLADSLLAKGRPDHADLIERFVRWWRRGEIRSSGTVIHTLEAALWAVAGAGLAIERQLCYCRG